MECKLEFESRTGEAETKERKGQSNGKSGKTVKAGIRAKLGGGGGAKRRGGASGRGRGRWWRGKVKEVSSRVWDVIGDICGVE